MSLKYPIIRPSLPSLDDVARDIERVLESGMITTSEYTRRFERGVAELTGAAHVIAVSSCTSGLMMVLRALGLTGEVILPSFTFTATGLAAVWCGLTPVFCDCTEGTLTLDPDSVARAISPATSAIMPVPVFGIPCDNQALADLAAQHDVALVFDSAQALGASYRGAPLGGFGNAEVFSLSPTKVITSIEGGLITTHDAELAQALRRMRDYGKGPDGKDITALGLSARFSEVHAIIGSYNLARAPDLAAERHRRIAAFRDHLADVPGLGFVDVPADRRASGIYMVLRAAGHAGRCSRDELVARLADRGVQAKPYFTPPLHQQTVYQDIPHRRAPSLAVSERAARECVAIPLYADMTDDEVAEVAALVRDAYLAGEVTA